jgi:hypothetical protein
VRFYMWFYIRDDIAKLTVLDTNKDLK